MEELAPSLLKEHVQPPLLELKSTWKRSQSDAGNGESTRSLILNKWSSILCVFPPVGTSRRMRRPDDR